MNKCFLLDPEKNLTQIHLVVLKKMQKTSTLIPKLTLPSRMLGYFNNQLNVSFMLLKTMVFESL